MTIVPTVEQVLETPRLLLEPIQASHAEPLWSSLQDPRLYEFVPTDPPASIEGLRTRYSLLESRSSPDGNESWLNWAMLDRASRWYVGTLQATVDADGVALIAYEVFPPLWRQGYASEGCERVIALLMDEQRVASLQALIDTRNCASISLVEHLGFSRIERLADADHFKGTTSHEYRYELLRSGAPRR